MAEMEQEAKNPEADVKEELKQKESAQSRRRAGAAGESRAGTEEENKSSIPILDGEEAEEPEAGEADEAETEEEAEDEEGAETAEEAGQEPDGEAQDTEQAGKGNLEKKGLFKRKEKKDKAAEQIADLNDKLKRQIAEFDNFRKRTEREKSQMYEIGAKSVIEKILPVVDNFERGLNAVPEGEQEDAFVQGMDKIYRQLMTELENIGVKPIEAVGQEFNPDFHNAVMQVESEEFESGIVAQELQKGYLYRDSVVRHSMVAVVQ